MDTVKLAASRDTSVRFAFPNQNFGTDTDLDINRALVAFDQTRCASLGSRTTWCPPALRFLLLDGDLRKRAAPRITGAFRLTRA
jgi:hypothetical protein